MFVVLILLTVTLLLCYVKLKYYSLRGSLPGLSPHLFFGNLIQSGVLFHDVLLDQAYLTFKARYGDTFQFWLGPMRYVVVNNINDIQYIFNHRHIYDQGDFFIEKASIIFPDTINSTKGANYKRHASITLPLLRRGKIIGNLDLIISCADKFLAKWHASPTKKVHTDIVDQCQNLLLSVFGLIAFDYDLETLDNDDDKSKNELTQALQDITSLFTTVIYSPTILASAYIKLSPRYNRAKKVIRQYFNRMIEKEQVESEESRAQRKRTSLIASLVDSLQKDEQAEAKKSEEEKRGLTRAELINEMLIILVGGFETTSTALSWFIHLMSQHPRVQQKIKEELKSSGDNQELSVERVESMIYLDCVLKEVFRLCPLVPITARTLTVDDRLPESNVQLKKGDHVQIPIYSLTRDTRHWSIDPERFYPERFLGADKNYHPCALLPFGGGHRQCIGQDLARFELRVIAARLMQHVTFGDGGPEVNAGRHLVRIATMPKHVGVTVDFD